MTQPKHQGIIILGMPRSGTTLLRRLLDGHPNIACPGETFLLKATARFLETESIAYSIDYGVLGGLGAAGFSEDEVLSELRALAFGFLATIAEREGKPRWAAKTAVESFYVDQIEKIYGDHAYFVCITRHGLDVVSSLKEFTDETQGYIRELHGYIKSHPRPLEAFAHAWADVTASLLSFVERHPENAILCRYEDLVAAPESTLERVLEFVGEGWDANVLRAAFDKKDVRGLGDWKTYGKSSIDEASVGRWKTLPQEAVRRLSNIVNPALKACGYEPVEAGEELTGEAAMRKYELAMMFNAIRSGDKAD